MRYVRYLFALLFLFSSCHQVFAHNRSESFSDWAISIDQSKKTVSGIFTVKEREATRIPSDQDGSIGSRLVDYLEKRVSFFTLESECQARRSTLLAAQQGFLRVMLEFHCSGDGLQLKMRPFQDLVSGHIHFARVRFENGSLEEYLFTARNPKARIQTKTGDRETSNSGFFDYFVIGIEHIVSGVDHLAFVLAVMLLARTGRNIAVAVSGFTLGHSVSLALAVLGFAEPNDKLVESLIGFTIALAAIEFGVSLTRSSAWAVVLLALVILSCVFVSGHPVVLIGLLLFSSCYLLLGQRLEKPERSVRPVVTGIFGLVHGFGFAGLLLNRELPTDQIVEALLGFNLGVELGQLAFVLATGVAVSLSLRMHLLSRFSRQLFRDVVLSGLAGFGFFLFIDRLI